MPTRLKDSLGDHVSVNAGESCNLKGTLKDTEGNAITSPQTLKITLYDQKSGVVVNSRKDQSVLNENGGVVTSGAYTIELDPDDTAIVGDVKEKETEHYAAHQKILPHHLKQLVKECKPLQIYLTFN